MNKKMCVLLFLTFGATNLIAAEVKGPVSKFIKSSRKVLKEYKIGSMPEVFFQLKANQTINKRLETKIAKYYGLKLTKGASEKRGTVIGYLGNILAFSSELAVEKLSIGHTDKNGKRVDIWGYGSKKPASEVSYRPELNKYGRARIKDDYTIAIGSYTGRKTLGYVKTVNPILRVSMVSVCAGKLNKEDDGRTFEVVTLNNGVENYHYSYIQYSSSVGISRTPNLALKNFGKKREKCISRQSFTAKEIGLGPISNI